MQSNQTSTAEPKVSVWCTPGLSVFGLSHAHHMGVRLRPHITKCWYSDSTIKYTQRSTEGQVVGQSEWDGLFMACTCPGEQRRLSYRLAASRAHTWMDGWTHRRMCGWMDACVSVLLLQVESANAAVG